jgi:hypothetical protein
MAKKPSQVVQSAQDAGDQVVEEHRRIKQSLDRLDHITDLRLMVPLLQELRILLDEHFEQEEAPDGFPAMIAEPAPHHARILDELFDEHKIILKTLDGVIANALFCLNGPFATIRREVTTVCLQLRAHETRETELLTDTVYTDLGIGD